MEYDYSEAWWMCEKGWCEKKYGNRTQYIEKAIGNFYGDGGTTQADQGHHNTDDQTFTLTTGSVKGKWQPTLTSTIGL